MVENFLEILSERKSSENDLSDITWALCLSSHSFQSLFLNFFFENTEFSNITKFEREASKGNSRVDFLIENNGEIYLIECKIYDTNHHLEQYTYDFGIRNERLGYITNYKMRQNGFSVKTWEEFYDYLTDNLNLPESESEKALWKGYLNYLKSVCGIVKITKKMDLKGMYSLYSFMELLKKLVNRKESDFELYYANKNIQGGNGFSGYYFKIKYSNDLIEETWPWIGVYYDRQNPLICLCFEDKEGLGKPVCEIIHKHLENIEQDEYYKKPYYEDGAIWFELTDEKHKEFDSTDLNGQIQIIKDFMDRVITKPLKLL
ncbi:MAG: hypothetical protein KatS3mg034_0710 [Vicingaceae bacterium]|nr:MAG: hypothetical protein KatS3mg034_0710 [Vicingaceae bacterium]